MEIIDPSITGRATRAAPSADIEAFDVSGSPPVTFTIQEFCVAHKISAAFYYTLKRAGLGPKEMVLGRRRIISSEAAADWRRERAAANETAAMAARPHAQSESDD
jgi:hypothetical protein